MPVRRGRQSGTAHRCSGRGTCHPPDPRCGHGQAGSLTPRRTGTTHSPEVCMSSLHQPQETPPPNSKTSYPNSRPNTVLSADSLASLSVSWNKILPLPQVIMMESPLWVVSITKYVAFEFILEHSLLLDVVLHLPVDRLPALGVLRGGGVEEVVEVVDGRAVLGMVGAEHPGRPLDGLLGGPAS